jgi:small conductance mechanosensitive channel
MRPGRRLACSKISGRSERWSTWVLVYVGAILSITALLAYVAKLVIWGLMRQSNPQITVAAQRLGVTIVWLVGAVLAVQELGVSVEILLLVIGLLGAAAIVALRQPLENFGAKYFTDVYTPFKIGDTVRVGDHVGRVIEINAMATVLLTEDDRLVSLPNSTFLRQSVINLTPQAWKEVLVPITIPSSTELASFENLMLKALSRMRTRLDRRYPPVFTVKSRNAQSTDLLLTLMVRRPEDRDPVLAEVNLRVTETMENTRRNPPSVPSESTPS